MDRRRYIPPSLGAGETELEHRQLPATSILGGIFGSSARPDEPPTIPLKRQRIKNLPFILQSFEPTRALPPSVVVPIQDDLRALLSLIHNPGQKVLLQFNRAIRATDATKHFSVAQADQLIHAFDIELNASGTDIALRKKFTADMKALAKLDAGGPEPGFQLTNDFAIIAQITQSVGQPMPAPQPTALLKAENIGKDGINLTIFHRPTFVGTATPNLEVVLALENGGIIATGRVNPNGQYAIKSGWPLANGQYKVKVYTFNDGYNSLESGAYVFAIRNPQDITAAAAPAAVPKGPRG